MSVTFGETPQPLTLPERVKRLRVQCYALLQGIPNPAPSRELALARTHLEEARMWMGNTLGEMGSTSPYQPNEIQRSFGNTTEIAPRADVAPPTELPEDPTKRADTIRGFLREYIREAKVIHTELTGVTPNHWAFLFWEEAVKKLTLSYNNCGMELGRIRDLTPTPEAPPEDEPSSQLTLSFG